MDLKISKEAVVISSILLIPIIVLALFSDVTRGDLMMLVLAIVAVSLTGVSIAFQRVHSRRLIQREIQMATELSDLQLNLRNHRLTRTDLGLRDI